MFDITLINIAMAPRYGRKLLYERNSVGIYLLIAALKRAGFGVSFCEYSPDPKFTLAQEALRLAKVVDLKAPFIGIGCHAVHLPFVVKISRELKKRFPEKRIILGGIGPTAVASSLLAAFDWIDAVVVGDGEEAVVEILKKRALGFKGIAGVVFREERRVIVNPLRSLSSDLDLLPLPAYEHMDFKIYKIPTIMASRGCPHECPFCSLSPFWGKKLRYRSIGNVLEELELLVRRYRVRTVFFGDPTFVSDEARVLELCGRLREKKWGLRWECLVRIDRMNLSLMKAMAAAGCEAVFFGLESGSDRVLKKIKQGFTVAQARQVVRRSLEHFKTVEVSFMWGFPFETLKDFKETLLARDYFEKKLGCEVQLRWLEPYPQTPLWVAYGRQLFLPLQESLIYNESAVCSGVRRGRDFYKNDAASDGIKIATDVTNVRFIIAASYTASRCRDIIEAHPDIFSDYYRYKTPSLKAKLALAQKYSLY